MMHMTLILYPITTEKGVGGIESQNKISFAVTLNATKPTIKQEFEKMFAQKVKKITVTMCTNGTKKATLTLEKKGAASEVAAKLKMV